MGAPPLQVQDLEATEWARARPESHAARPAARWRPPYRRGPRSRRCLDSRRSSGTRCLGHRCGPRGIANVGCRTRSVFRDRWFTGRRCGTAVSSIFTAGSMRLRRRRGLASFPRPIPPPCRCAPTPDRRGVLGEQEPPAVPGIAMKTAAADAGNLPAVMSRGFPAIPNRGRIRNYRFGHRNVGNSRVGRGGFHQCSADRNRPVLRGPEPARSGADQGHRGQRLQSGGQLVGSGRVDAVGAEPARSQC